VCLIKTWSLPLADDSGSLVYKEVSHVSLFLHGFCPHFLHASPLQPELDYACQLGLVVLMTTRYTEITLINRLCKALPVVSTLQKCNASHVQKDMFSLPTSAKNHFTDVFEVKINLAG